MRTLPMFFERFTFLCVKCRHQWESTFVNSCVVCDHGNRLQRTLILTRTPIG